MRDNLPRETEGVASAQSWTQHLFQERDILQQEQDQAVSTYGFLPTQFVYGFGFHTDSTTYYVLSRPHLPSMNVFPSFEASLISIYQTMFFTFFSTACV